MPSQAEVDAAVLAEYQAALSRLRARVVAAVEAAWGSLRAWREPDIAGFVAQATPVVLGGQRQVAALTTAYLARQRAAVLGGPLRPVAVRPARVSGAAVRNGTDPATVYGRAGVQVWRDLAAGKPLDIAVQAGERRAVQAAATDLQLTKARTAHEVLKDDKKVVGYRRVLTGDKSCALCVVASTQRYHRKELLPCHPQCDCSVEALYTEQGQVIDEETLVAAHDAIKKTFGVSDAAARNPDYRKILIVHQHGEYGPTLAVAGHRFSGPKGKRSGLDLSNVPRLN